MSQFGGPAQGISPGKRIYYRLLAAQILALVSTGVATIALALLAYTLAGADAGAVLGMALGIKMLAYVAVTPVASAFVERLPRRSTLVALDLVRAAVVLALPFVTRVGEIYLLIFIFQAASAAFTPVFQSTIPELLPDRAEYTRALSLSRLAVELENVVSPMLAAAALLVVSFRGLFVGTVFGFLLSAAIILAVALPYARKLPAGGIWRRTVWGIQTFIATPRLRGLMALNAAVAAATAMVVVNTVVYVQAELGLTDRATAVALTVYGLGSVAGAILLSHIMIWTSDRSAMLAGGAVIAVGLICGAAVTSYFVLLPIWFALGFGGAIAQTPAGILVCRSSGDDDRQSLYAAQLTLSNAWLLLAYPLAGLLGADLGIPAAFFLLGLIACTAVTAAALLWPPGDRAALDEVQTRR